MASVRPVVVARSGPLFIVLGIGATIYLIVSAVVWAGASAVNDQGTASVSLVFVVLSAVGLFFSVLARKNIKLFANEELIGSMGIPGGIRLCSRQELSEVRVVWHRFRGRGQTTWAFPVLHFRRRDQTDAFFVPAILYRRQDLQNLAAYLGVSISLERPLEAA